MALCSCTVTKKVKTGEDAYKYKQYKLATELLESEYNNATNNKEKARHAYLLARSYDYLQLFGDALLWYDTADQLSYAPHSESDLAYALKRNERYQDAQKLFLDIYKKTKDQKYRTEAELCRLAIEAINNSDDYIITPYAANSKYSDYSPVFYENDYLIFTSDRQQSTGNKLYKWNEHEFSDIFIANKRGRNVHNFDPTINSEANEGTAAFNRTFDEIFFTRCVSADIRDQYCKIYYSVKPNDFWVEPEVMPFFGDKTNFGHPTLIENDSVLVFSVSPEGSDNYDLYYSVRLDDGWSVAEIMPTTINSVGDEKFPTSYNDTLYFSSDGHPGYGGLDIFSTYLRSDGSWASPVNLGIPINSGSDDFSMAVDPNYRKKGNVKSQGYFSSSRNTGFSDDIFYYAQYDEDSTKDPEGNPDVITQVDEYIIYIAGRVVEVIHQNDDPNQKIIDKKTLKDAKIIITSEDYKEDIRTDKSGRFLLEVDPGSYDILASKQDYLANQKTIIAERSMVSDTTINIEIDLEKIIYNTEIKLNNIYYDFEKWDIREDAKPALDSLYTTLSVNSDLNIQLSSHTDCRGPKIYNNELSQKRAQSAVNYLVKKGIAKSRLSAVGYGETIPAIQCNCDDCTEQQHQINRRTTFTILQ